MIYYFKLTNTYLNFFSALISDKLNIKRYLLHEQNLFGVLRPFSEGSGDLILTCAKGHVSCGGAAGS